jgi:hypothetical protein
MYVPSLYFILIDKVLSQKGMVLNRSPVGGKAMKAKR